MMYTQADFSTAVAQNTLDMVKAFKLDHASLPGRLSARLFRGPVSRVTRTVFQYDQRVGQQGLALSSAWLLDHFTRCVRVHNLPSLPDHQPLLITSNHPGLVDAMAIFASVECGDLRIIAAERPILRLLPNITRHLIFLPDDPGRRLPAIREAASHLRGGGTLLTFPAGKIEPDPALYPTAAGSLANWSESVNLFARLVPGLQVLPVAVSGVISPDALRHPLTRLYRTPAQQSWVAATLQIMLSRYHDVEVDLRFGRLLPVGPSIAADIHDEMRLLVAASFRA